MRTEPSCLAGILILPETFFSWGLFRALLTHSLSKEACPDLAGGPGVSVTNSQSSLSSYFVDLSPQQTNRR